MPRGRFRGVDGRTQRRMGHRNGGKVRAPVRQSKFTAVRQLCQARVAAGMTRNDLADKSGYPEMIIGRYERGETTPSLNALQDLANALGCELALVPLVSTLVSTETADPVNP